jgi:hypothetical protein
MGIYRTNNPLEFDEVDGIVIDEKAPSPQVQGVGTGVAILVGQFQRGLQALESISSLADFQEKFGKSSFSGNVQLKNKKFASGMKIIRVIASDAAAAQILADDGAATDLLQFDAKSKGAYGNSLSVEIVAGTVSGVKITVSDDNADAVLQSEEYDNYLIADGVAPFAGSSLVDVVLLASSAEPAVAAKTALAAGSDGTVADTDYEDALVLAEAEWSGNILFLDSYNATRNAYLKIHAGLTQDKMCILAGPEAETVSEAVTAVGTLRDTDGRLVYAYNWVQTLVEGVATMTSPASWYASILSQTAPHIDPAFTENSKYLFGALSLKNGLTRADYKALMEAGISSFEFDPDVGFKVKSGVVTQILSSSKLTVLRRRMADYLTVSIAVYLKNYQNAVNSEDNRVAVKGAILNFIGGQEALGILPKDSEVNGGGAKLVDIATLNTDSEIAAGKFYIQYKQRIYSSMRFIVLRAEIGESVVVTEGE